MRFFALCLFLVSAILTAALPIGNGSQLHTRGSSNSLPTSPTGGSSAPGGATVAGSQSAPPTAPSGQTAPWNAPGAWSIPGANAEAIIDRGTTAFSQINGLLQKAEALPTNTPNLANAIAQAQSILRIGLFQIQPMIRANYAFKQAPTAANEQAIAQATPPAEAVVKSAESSVETLQGLVEQKSAPTSPQVSAQTPPPQAAPQTPPQSPGQVSTQSSEGSFSPISPLTPEQPSGQSSAGSSSPVSPLTNRPT